MSAAFPAERVEQTIADIGPRLRALRRRRGATLAEVAEATGISVSVLSRLESGKRRPTLELLMPLARVHRVPLDELADAPVTGDPRVHLRAANRGDTTIIPLTRRPGGLQAYKMILPPASVRGEPRPTTHEGYEWFYVLDGRLRLVLGPHDVLLGPGEAAEFDTHVPHWFGSADERPAEILSLFGPQGERAHVRASAPGPRGRRER